MSGNPEKKAAEEQKQHNPNPLQATTSYGRPSNQSFLFFSGLTLGFLNLAAKFQLSMGKWGRSIDSSSVYFKYL